MLTILIVDDQPSVLHALYECFALEPDLKIVGKAEDGVEALTLVRELRPDILLTDIKMPRMDGIATTVALREIASETRVVILSVYDDHATRKRAFASGAAAFVGKHDSAEVLIAELRRVAGDQEAESSRQ